ncbi:MAG: hypothetical protein Q8Q69_01195, partial [Nitrosopumilaceae archaeon]|nr:hypothetical protein [Nitrosopumilaceae archaeon]
TKEVSVIPFSKKVIESYHNLLEDIHLIFHNVINSRLFIVQRNVNGMLPYRDDHFSKKLDETKKTMLNEMWKKFEEKHPPITSKWEGEIAVQAKYAPWYQYLDDYYSKPLFQMLDDNITKSSKTPNLNN